MTTSHDATRERFEDELGGPDEAFYELTLFVSGASELSARAIAHAKRLCDVYLDGRYRLTVVDVHEDPAAAHTSGVLAAPTLVKNRPLPVRKLVGDLSGTDEVLSALQLLGAKDAPSSLS